MIILRTKTFTDNKKGKEGYYKGDKGKDYKNWADFLNDMIRGQIQKETEEREKAKYSPRPNKKKDSHLKRVHEDTANIQRDIDILEAEKKLKDTKEKLKNLRNPKPAPDTRNRFEKINDSIKSKVSDPKFKKGIKVAGLTTLGVGAATGLVAGGIKLKRKLDEKKSNKKVKEQIAGEEEKLEQKEYTSIKRKINAKIARGRVNVAQKMGD